MHQFAAKNEKKTGGMPPDPPNPRFPIAQRQISIQAVFSGGAVNLFRKYPTNPKLDPPSKIPGHGPGYYALIIWGFSWRYEPP